MSQQRVEVQNQAVRIFFSAFEDDSDAFRGVLDPEIVWFPIEENRTPTRGVEAAMWNRDHWLNTWSEHRMELEEVIEDGDEVVVLVHIRGRGRASGVEADVRFYAQFRAGDGKITYIYDHDDRAAALEAAGLSE